VILEEGGGVVSTVEFQASNILACGEIISFVRNITLNYVTHLLMGGIDLGIF
jgi:hypothetical protein